MIDTLWLIIGGIGAAGLVLWRVFSAGRKSQQQETALQAAERMAKTRKRMDDVPSNIGATDDTVIKRLRDHAGR
jgi:type II secretory pathway pseudopilin PulG